LQTLLDSDKISQTYVGRTQISHVKFWRPGPNGRKMAAKKVGVFSNWYSELAFY